LVPKVRSEIIFYKSIQIKIGDYGRGGVEAIRRLLNKDACIGADLTMVNVNRILC
jgi:hypothetical protein